MRPKMHLDFLKVKSMAPSQGLTAVFTFLLPLCFLAFAVPANAETPFEFQKDDVVAIYGNGLADLSLIHI